MLAAMRWGVIIGATNLVWLYLSFWIGLHTSGPILFQVVPAVWFIITMVGYVVAFRAIFPVGRPEWASGLQVGLTIAVVTALFGVLQQVGYYTIVHPEWPEVMMAQTRDYFAGRGASEAEIAHRVEVARGNFTLRNYAVQSAGAALVLGAVLTVVVTAWLRRRGPGAGRA